MEENNNVEEIDRDFEYKIKLLEKKFKKANKPKDVRKALDEFEKLSEDFVEKQKCLKNYETLEDFFERKVRKLIDEDHDSKSDYARIWLYMIPIFQFMGKIEKARKCRKVVLKSMGRDFVKCDVTDVGECTTGCGPSPFPYHRLFPSTNHEIFIVNEELEHKNCMKIINAIEPKILPLVEQFELPDAYSTIYEHLLIWVARMSMRLENYAQAVKEFRKASKHMKAQQRCSYYEPKTFVLYHAAMCFMKLKNVAFAEKTFVKCIETQNPATDGVTICDDADCPNSSTKQGPNLINCARMTLGHIYYEERKDGNKAIACYIAALRSISKSVLDVQIDDVHGISYTTTCGAYNAYDFKTAKDRLIHAFADEDNASNDDLTEEEESQYRLFTDMIEKVESLDLDWEVEDVPMMVDFLDMCEVWMITFLNTKYLRYRVNLYRLRAKCHLAIGNTHESSKEFQKSYFMLTDEEEKRETIEIVAWLEEELNDYDNALDFVIMAMGELKLDADGKPSDGGLTHLHCATIIFRIYFKLKQYEDALSHIQMTEKVIANCRNVVLLYYKGRCYHELGQYELAVTQFNLSIENDDITNECYLHKGRSLMMLKRYEEAQKSILKGKLDIQSLILLIVNAKILQRPYQNYIKKLFKKCLDSIGPLRESVWICPKPHLSTFLNTLVQESNREEKYVTFRHSVLMSKHFDVR